MGRRAREARREAALTHPDPFRFTTIAHAGRDILGPVSPASLDAMLAAAPKDLAPGTTVDVGCGKGEVLVRALERLGGTGIGVEPNPSFAAEARERITRRLGSARAVILDVPLAEARLPERAFGFGICTGALHAFGDWRATLRGLAALVRPGSSALLGPGYWKRPPHADYLRAIEGEEGEQHSLPETLAIAEDHGWHIVACHESTPEEWDDYEGSYAARIREWCDTHPDDPEAGTTRARIDHWTDAYGRWGRDTMGYALLLLRNGQ